MPAWAAPPEPAALIAKINGLYEAQGVLANKYVHREEVTHTQLNKSGKSEPDRTEVFEVMFLEGSPYRKLILQDGKPLTTAKQAKVDAELEKERTRRAGQKRSSLLHRTVYFTDISELPRLCDLTVTETTLDGREVWKLEAAPKPDAKPKTAADRGTVGTKQVFLVDKQDFAIVKEERTFLTSQGGMQPGTVFAFEFQKINNEVWLPVHSLLTTRFKPVIFVDVNLTTDTKFVSYRKFDVETSVDFAKPD
jgi:hypothetical protein